ncbi:MAG TPA: MBOAT family O-acyltransferase [Stellaceae bacterium]|nr:MBOAT family O-acyltransferase [Stellaceae bacterium]
MLFSTYQFIFGFLPIALAGYWLLARHVVARLWFLLFISLIFYSYWDWRFTPLLIGSIVVNWAAAEAFFAYKQRLILVAAITADLTCLGIFKYLGFFESILFDSTGWNPSLARLALPLGISFFTFHHIIYLADLLRGRAPRYRFRDYALYIALFPQILAGPLVRHREIIPQLPLPPLRSGWEERIVRGVLLFIIGLAKKSFIADTLAASVDPAFVHAVAGSLSIGEAWTATLGFTLQIYFDFSGYSDMAIGLALLFGFALPYNFDVPYRATSLHQLWRRWHMTLLRFLRDYLFIPVAGSRPSVQRHIWALLTTMLLTGLWHGAGWTFIIWGMLHGIGMSVEVLWRQRGLPMPSAIVGWILTIVFWTLAAVIFRAPSLHAAFDVFAAMAGNAPNGPLLGWPTIVAAAVIAMVGPSSQELTERLKPAAWLAPVAALATVLVLLRLNDGPSYEFIYFHF